MALSNFLRRVLRRLFGALRGRSPDLVIPQHTTLSRFIFSTRHFSKTSPKPPAFLPRETDLRISASWIDKLLESEIWQIGDGAGRARQKLACARADFQKSIVDEVRLTIEQDPVPDNSRHVNISGWPSEKDRRMSIAQDLCAKSMLRIRQEAD